MLIKPIMFYLAHDCNREYDVCYYVMLGVIVGGRGPGQTVRGRSRVYLHTYDENYIIYHTIPLIIC